MLRRSLIAAAVMAVARAAKFSKADVDKRVRANEGSDLNTGRIRGIIREVDEDKELVYIEWDAKCDKQYVPGKDLTLDPLTDEEVSSGKRSHKNRWWRRG